MLTGTGPVRDLGRAGADRGESQGATRLRGQRPAQPGTDRRGTRRHSGDDIDRINNRINKITALLEKGLNLAGVAHMRDLEAEISLLRGTLRRRRGDRDEID